MSAKRTRAETVALARRFLDDFAALDKRGAPTTEVDWLMLKFSCSEREAAKLVAAVRGGKR